MGGLRRGQSWGQAAWLVGYLVVLLATTAALARARAWALRELATPQARAAWDHWRNAAQRDSVSRGPVQRVVPRSTEPPALVLLRDYFAAVLAGAIIFATALYAVLAFLLRGALASGRSPAKGNEHP